jgi:hypothetical protein
MVLFTHETYCAVYTKGNTIFRIIVAKTCYVYFSLFVFFTLILQNFFISTYMSLSYHRRDAMKVHVFD